MPSRYALQRILCKLNFAIDYLQTDRGTSAAASRLTGWRPRTRSCPPHAPLRSARLSRDPPRALSAGLRGRRSPSTARGRPPSPGCARCPRSRTRWCRWRRAGELLGRRVAHVLHGVLRRRDARDPGDRGGARAAHVGAPGLDPARLGQLYWRIKTLHDQLDELELDPEQRYLVERQLPRDVARRRGARRRGEGAADARSTSGCRRSPRRSRRISCADTNDLAVVFDDVAELDGLTEGELSAAAQAAADRGLDGRWVVTLTLFTGHPYLAVADEPRRAASASSTPPRARGSRGNDNDNRGVLREIVRLRAERAALLGYDIARRVRHVRRDRRLAGGRARPAATPRRPRRPQRAREQAALQAIIDAEPEPFTLEAHDWAFYTEKVRAAEYDLDRAALRPWFEAERVLQDGVFHAATELYGVTFAERSDLARLPPRRPRVRGAQRRRVARSASSCSISTRATPSAAARG